ncbi:DUF3999 domain-containing protein [Paraburkholderia sp. BCC1884]|uniref:DUF3999 domain-containing protein n=1 Tax=Paraburkholderia sp. BCC1884 TaxID=2562668 RepID=UPI0011831555|nr:DUF3999 domain-containing protein [Paraburkholderia sp. BCC1884]
MKHVLKLTGWYCALVAVLASSPTFAADEFAQRFALQLGGGAAYYNLTLPAAVYAASQRSDLGDLRVLNAAGEPVPYALDAPGEAPRAPSTLHPASWFSLPPPEPGSTAGTPGVAIGADGSLHATAAPPARQQHDTDLIDLGPPPRANRVSALLVHLRDDNYQGRVTVDASDDLRHWQPAGGAQLLKVSYNGSTLSQDRIELDGARGRYLRVHWLDGSPYVESLDMEVQATGADRMARGDAQRAWREGIAAHAGPKAGEYYFATGGSYPVDRLRLNLPQPNTVTPAVVYSRPSLDAPWREVASATLFRLHNGDVEQTNPSLELAPDTDRQWRVMIYTRNGGIGNGDLSISAGWRPATLTFVAQGDAPFTLAVGSAGAASAAVSRADLHLEASAVAATAHLGDPIFVTPDQDGTAAGKDSGLQRRYWLWGALVLAVGSLAAIGWRLARGMRVHAAGVGAAPASGGSGVASATGSNINVGGPADASGPGEPRA